MEGLPLPIVCTWTTFLLMLIEHYKPFCIIHKRSTLSFHVMPEAPFYDLTISNPAVIIFVNHLHDY